jgi:hypothetical protein
MRRAARTNARTDLPPEGPVGLTSLLQKLVDLQRFSILLDALQFVIPDF